MSMPPTFYLRDLGPQAQIMARNCGSDSLTVAIQYVVLGSMIVMTGLAAS